jgi:hypothetical protein
MLFILVKTNHQDNAKDDYDNNYGDNQVSTVNDGGCP